MYKLKAFLPIFSLLLLASTSGMISAQEPITDTTKPQNIILSPSKIYVYDDDYGQTYDITIKNTTTNTLHFSPVEIHITNSPGNTLDITEEITDNYLYFEGTEITLKPNEIHHLMVRVKLNIEEINVYPAINFTSTGADEETLQLITDIYTVFILQDTSAELDYKIDAEIPSNLPFIYAKTFDLNGSITNIGSKFFEPVGTVSIKKGEQLLFDRQITTQIQGVLLPTEKQTFTIEWDPDDDIIKSIGIYEIEVNVQATPYSKATTYNLSVVYIPREILVAGAITSIAIIAISITIAYRKKKY